MKLRANEAIASYYDGWLRCDEACACVSRCVCCRATGDAAPGQLSAQHPQCSGRVTRQYTESDLYKQLSHFVRQLDVAAALSKVRADGSPAPLAVGWGSVFAPGEGRAELRRLTGRERMGSSIAKTRNAPNFGRESGAGGLTGGGHAPSNHIRCDQVMPPVEYHTVLCFTVLLAGWDGAHPHPNADSLLRWKLLAWLWAALTLPVDPPGG